jgi:C4-dicarboxylate-specific signal transduction histidine kinase
VAVDRHRLLEILINLIQNSRQAMESASDTPRRLSISLKACSERRVKIEVSDTGCGIDAEGLRHVFDHGYTTKRGGNGFGLHSSANAAGEMGAQLTALSDGTGCGATFVLELPTQPHSEPVEPA